MDYSIDMKLMYNGIALLKWRQFKLKFQNKNKMENKDKTPNEVRSELLQQCNVVGNAFIPLELSQYKGATNAWLDKEGNLFECGYQNHNEWSYEFLDAEYPLHKENPIEFAEKIGGSLFDYGYQLLHRLGWWRILDWKTSSGIQLLKEGDEELTYKQKETLEFWCAVNGVDYEKFIPHNLL